MTIMHIMQYTRSFLITIDDAWSCACSRRRQLQSSVDGASVDPSTFFLGGRKARTPCSAYTYRRVPCARLPIIPHFCRPHAACMPAGKHHPSLLSSGSQSLPSSPLWPLLPAVSPSNLASLWQEALNQAITDKQAQDPSYTPKVGQWHTQTQ